MSNNLIPITTRLDEELYHRIKVMAVMNNTSIQELISLFIKDGLQKLNSGKND